jgi:hypothetical protein
MQQRRLAAIGPRQILTDVAAENGSAGKPGCAKGTGMWPWLARQQGCAIIFRKRWRNDGAETVAIVQQQYARMHRFPELRLYRQHNVFQCDSQTGAGADAAERGVLGLEKRDNFVCVHNKKDKYVSRDYTMP